MVSNYPHSVASHNGGSTGAETHGEGLGERVIGRLRHLVCGVQGHDTVIQGEHGRMFLRCLSCGHETPGWELSHVPPTITAAREVQRPAVSRPQLIAERRIA
jgi:hypothetical protein